MKHKINIDGPIPPWVKKHMESWNPEEIVPEVMEILENETACVGLLKAFAAFNAMATALDQKDDVKCCCRLMEILDEIRSTKKPS